MNKKEYLKDFENQIDFIKLKVLLNNTLEKYPTDNQFDEILKLKNKIFNKK